MKKGVMLVGEPMGLFIAQQEGELERVETFSCAVAGAEFNVAVGLSRLGHSVGYLTKLGRDPFGARIVNTLEVNSISTNLVSWSDTHPTGFMLKAKTSQGDPEIFYFRRDSAASNLCPEDVEQLDFSPYRWLHLTGILPALSRHTRQTAFRLVERAKEEGLTISFDPNLRVGLWQSEAEMIDLLNDIACKSDIILPGEKEGFLLTGESTPEGVAHFYLNRGASAVLVKLGNQGAYVATKEFAQNVSAFPVGQVVDTVGAGDGFAAGVISALLEGQTLPQAALWGNGVGAIQVMSVGDNDGLPTRETLAKFMGMKTL